MTRQTSHKVLNAAALVPALALFLLLPPFITLFAAPVTVFGVPLMVVYLFGVWALLVLAAAWLAPRLAVDATRGGQPDRRGGADAESSASADIDVDR